MYIPHYELPLYDRKERGEVRYRWELETFRPLKQKVFEIIKEGGSKHRIRELLAAYEQKELLESDDDLRGFDFAFQQTTIESGKPNGFRYFNLKYAIFSFGVMKDWTFFENGFMFTRFMGMEFDSCWFDNAEFYGATFENVKFINCNFAFRNRFLKCTFENAQFDNCYFSQPAFKDCCFDERTLFTNIQKACSKNENNKLEDKNYAALLKGIKDGYLNGECYALARSYYFQQMQTLRRFNSTSFKEQIFRWFFEKTTGYGIKPVNTFLWMLGIFFLFSLIFVNGLYSVHAPNPIWNGLLLSAGSFFTFGANTDFLNYLSDGYKAFFILEAAAGIGLSATLITVLANFWFNWEK